MPALSAFRDRLGAVLAGAGLAQTPLPLLDVALTHTSFLHEASEEAGEDNERLEFLGDAVLGLCAAEMLYEQRPWLDPGEMTRLRAELVSGESLAAVAREWQLGDDLRLGRGEEISGGRARPSNLSRAMEAVVGAVYLSAGFRGASAVTRAALGGKLVLLLSDPASRDPKSALQEWAQAHGAIPVYQVVARDGPDHAPKWTVSVRVESMADQATASSRRQAEKDAARRLFTRLAAPGREALL